ncbi:thioesterase II family protein [Streptomyces sp. NPDC127098]|uniref:thioesterase II family protein n=1 Tax=Streptomyces sp. NPDC127098 TaxID=3347137 RepID=UPI0036565E79
MTDQAAPTAPADTDRWIRRYHPQPDSPVRLVCLPHAGGSASFYFSMSRALAGTAEVLAVQYPGRQDRLKEPPLETVQQLADAVYAALLPWADRPLAFFGHSMGAVVAFETARRLEREKGLVAPALFASGRRAPATRRAETVHHRDDEGLVAELRNLSGTNSQLLADSEIMRMVLPAIRADYRAIETYVRPPGPGLRCPLHVLTGDADPKVTEAEAEAWREETEGPFDLRVFPGGHFYLTEHQEAVTATVAATLRSAPA